MRAFQSLIDDGRVQLKTLWTLDRLGLYTMWVRKDYGAHSYFMPPWNTFAYWRVDHEIENVESATAMVKIDWEGKVTVDTHRNRLA